MDCVEEQNRGGTQGEKWVKKSHFPREGHPSQELSLSRDGKDLGSRVRQQALAQRPRWAEKTVVMKIPRKNKHGHFKETEVTEARGMVGERHGSNDRELGCWVRPDKAWRDCLSSKLKDKCQSVTQDG